MGQLTTRFHGLKPENRQMPFYLQEILDKLPETSAVETYVVLFPQSYPAAMDAAFFQEQQDVFFAFKTALMAKNADAVMKTMDGINGGFHILTIMRSVKNTLRLCDENQIARGDTLRGHMEQLEKRLPADFEKFMQVWNDCDMIGAQCYFALGKGNWPDLTALAARGVSLAAAARYWDVNPAWPKPARLDNPPRFSGFGR